MKLSNLIKRIEDKVTETTKASLRPSNIIKAVEVTAIAGYKSVKAVKAGSLRPSNITKSIEDKSIQVFNGTLDHLKVKKVIARKECFGLCSIDAIKNDICKTCHDFTLCNELAVIVRKRG